MSFLGIKRKNVYILLGLTLIIACLYGYVFYQKSRTENLAINATRASLVFIDDYYKQTQHFPCAAQLNNFLKQNFPKVNFTLDNPPSVIYYDSCLDGNNANSFTQLCYNSGGTAFLKPIGDSENTSDEFGWQLNYNCIKFKDYQKFIK